MNAHTHLEYANYAGFGDGAAVRPVDHDAHRAQGAARRRRTCSRSPGSARSSRCASGVTTDRRLQLLRRGRDAAAAEPGCGRSSTSRSSPSTRRTRSGSATEKRAHVEETAARPDRHLAARARTPARSTRTGAASRSASRSARTSPRARTRTSGSCTAAARSQEIGRSSCRRPGSAPVAALEPVLGPDLLCAHCVDVDDRRDRAARRAGRAGRPLPALERAARLRRRTADGASRRRRPRRARHRLAGLDAVLRPVRGAPRTPSTRPAPASGAPTRCGAADALRARDDRLGPRAATRRRGGYPDAPESAPI